MSALTTLAGSKDLTEQERRLLAAARSMKAESRRFLLRAAEGLARDHPASAPRLTLAHSGPGRAHQ